MYQWYQIMICLLKFDFFCFAGVTMQVGSINLFSRTCDVKSFKQLLIIVLQSNSAEFALTIAAIPIVLVLLIFCGIAVKREIKW